MKVSYIATRGRVRIEGNQFEELLDIADDEYE
jgi:hypothetical protein